MPSEAKQVGRLLKSE